MIIGQPTGIVKCLPESWLIEAGGEVYLERVFDNGVAKGRAYFCISMPAKPRIEVLHFYLVIAGRLRYRLNIAGYEGPSTRTVASGQPWKANCWALLSNPVIKPPHEWPVKGFRGFRYTEDLW